MEVDTSSTLSPRKVCKKCSVGKRLIEDFYAAKRNKDGRASYCKECSKAAGRAWAKANPERHRANVAKWVEANPEKHRANTAKWNRANQEAVRAYGERWRKANPEKCRAKYAARAKANPEAVRSYTAKRRAIKRAYVGQHYTASDVKVLLVNQHGFCAYCGEPMNPYHIDHIVPLSKGGGNNKENIALACAACNLSKGNKLLSEWKKGNE